MLRELEGDAHLAAGLLDAGVDLARPRGAAELLLEIVLATDTGAGHVGVQLVGVPRHRDRRVGMPLLPERERLLEAALADVAPRADHVGHDVEGERHARSSSRGSGRR
jgi:hypothetical protein